MARETVQAGAFAFATLILVRIFPASADSSIAPRSAPLRNGAYTATYRRCIPAAHGVTAALEDCNAAELKVQNARLDRVSAMVMRKLSSSRQSDFRASQQLWINRRNATCKRVAQPYTGGTLAHVVYPECLLSETIQRTTFIEKHR